MSYTKNNRYFCMRIMVGFLTNKTKIEMKNLKGY